MTIEAFEDRSNIGLWMSERDEIDFLRECIKRGEKVYVSSVDALLNAFDRMQPVAKRAAEFISERDPFGDQFSAHDLHQLNPEGGYMVDGLAEATAQLGKE